MGKAALPPGVQRVEAMWVALTLDGTLRMSTNERRSRCVDYPELLIGIDGGGTKTTARLARRGSAGLHLVIGQGKSGPGNPRAAGESQAREHISEAVNRAFAAADLVAGTVQAACLALAGVALRRNGSACRCGHPIIFRRNGYGSCMTPKPCWRPPTQERAASR